MNAPLDIRAVGAVPCPPPKLTPVERRIYAELARADGQYIACADLVVRIDGAPDARRMRSIMRYVGNVRIALRGQTEHAVVSAGSGADLRYALVAVSEPTDEAARRQRAVLQAAAPEGDKTRKGRITEALIAAGGRYIGVVDLCRLGGLETNANGLSRIRSLVNEIRSTLRIKGIAASILTQGVGDALAYAWSDTIEAAAPDTTAPGEADPDAPRPTLRITLPPIGGRSCVYDGDSLVLDGVKQPRVERRA